MIIRQPITHCFAMGAVLVGAVLFLSGGNALAVNQPYRIALLADPHVATTGDEAAYQQNFQAIIDNVNQLGVNRVLIAGDLSQNGQDAQFTRYKQMIAGFTAPVLSIAGNHDVGDKISPIMPSNLSDARLDKYVAQIGPLFYSQTIAPGVRIVGATSSLMGSGLSREATQWTFLANNLAHTAPDEKVILLMHYPAFLDTPDEGSLYSNIEPGPRAQLLQLLDDNNTDLVLSGHVHRPIENNYNGVRMIGAPAVSFGVPDTQPPGWTLLTIMPDGSITEDIRLFPLQAPEPATTSLLLFIACGAAMRRGRARRTA